MSEYQYYEFQTLDRPLSEAERRELRALSTRAQITATSFTNHYDWGDFSGDPQQLVERCFDLHVYLTNWGTRRLIMRLPRRLIARARLNAFVHDMDWVAVWEKGENLIVDMYRDEVDMSCRDWDDGSGWLGELAPLRAAVLAGDLRLFYVLWLTALEDGLLDADAREPLSGIGPLTSALEAAADFFDLDRDLLQAAAERDDGSSSRIAADVMRAVLAGLPDAEKTDLLMRVVDGDTHVAAELIQGVREGYAAAPVEPRTAGALAQRAAEIRDERERAEAARRAAEQRRREEEAARARRKRLVALRGRGEAVWQEIETEIARRNPPGYDHAAALLFDLQAIAAEDGALPGFVYRLDAIRDRHARKGRFLERLEGLGGG